MGSATPQPPTSGTPVCPWKTSPPSLATRQGFPVLEKYTQTVNPLERPRQPEALFQPPVALPTYQRGQFKKEPGKDAKLYP